LVQYPSGSLKSWGIAFASGDSNSDIFVMNADGSNPTNLTNNPAIDLSPAWSPDGSKIAFVSTRDFTPGGDVSKAFEIYVMTAAGSNPIRLTDNTDQDADPSWSPDSSKLTFTTFRGGNFEIYAMNADGTSQVNLSNNSSSDFQPVWSPDGNRIAFLSFRDSVFNIPQEIYVMNSDGTDQRNLTRNPQADGGAMWFPSAFDEYGQRVIRDQISNLIDVTEEEATVFCCNAVVLDRDIVLPEGAPNLVARLQERGYTCHQQQMSEFLKAGGACKCLTMFMPQRGSVR
jgi:Tol biopolymer transport system component